MILTIHQAPSLTQRRYEEVVRRLTGGKDQFVAAGDVGVPGLLAHVAAQTDAGFLIFDVLESRTALDALSATAAARWQDSPSQRRRYATGVAAEPIAISVVIAISRARASRTGEWDSAR